ncbi:hypothetical protein EJD97_018130 [Solanum chilense]|uniref:Uncharacterized protein n=1 Tax=Solanum chilense TaxID=4083 RepID=A0A6N2B5E8_SOLCI|nr:hypothetical protein EJD97_018130 [Solanum chilense]
MGTTDRRGGLVPKHLDSENLGVENRLSELHDGSAGRTVVGTTDRHKSFIEIESLNSVKTLQEGPSQARRAVTSDVTLTGSDFC